VVEDIGSEFVIVETGVELRVQIGLLVDMHHHIVLHFVVFEELGSETHLIGDCYVPVGEES
jgi:hypothetical protein